MTVIPHPLATQRETRELATRIGAGAEITLLWHPDSDTTSIRLCDLATRRTWRFQVRRDLALDAYYHPAAHLRTWFAA